MIDESVRCSWRTVKRKIHLKINVEGSVTEWTQSLLHSLLLCYQTLDSRAMFFFCRICLLVISLLIFLIKTLKYHLKKNRFSFVSYMKRRSFVAEVVIEE